jgi:MFS family permease
VALLSRFGPLVAYRELRHEYDRAIFVLAAGDLVASFGFSLVFPFLTIYLTSVVGASATQSGLVLGLYSVASIGSNAAGGWLADRVGRKAVMVGSITLTSLIVAAMGQVHDLVGIGALTLALGIVDPAFVPAARAAVADVVPAERRQRAYGLLGVAASIGWIGGPAIGAGLATLGYPILFSIAGAILLGYTAILLVAFRETRPEVEPGSVDRAPAASAVTSSALQEPQVVHGPVFVPAQRPETVDSIDRARWVFVAFLPIGVLIHAATFQWVTTLPIHASRDLGVSTTTWGLLFALNGLLIVLFQLRMSTLTERWRKPVTMALGLALYTLGYVAVAAAHVPGLTVVVLASIVALVTFGEMLVFPVEPAFVSDLSPLDVRGRYQGVFGAAAGLGSAIGPPLGGLALDGLADPLPWLAIAACGAVASGSLLWLATRMGPSNGGSRLTPRGAMSGGRA